jgi:hypothetical protein
MYFTHKNLLSLCLIVNCDQNFKTFNNVVMLMITIEQCVIHSIIGCIKEEITLARWVDKTLDQTLFKHKIKSRF